MVRITLSTLDDSGTKTARLRDDLHMAAGLFLFLILLVVAFVALLIVALVVWVPRSGERLHRLEKAELRELRDLVTRIDRIAYGGRETEPNLAFSVIDEINRYKQKELE
jgi:hypothetical protein